MADTLCNGAVASPCGRDVAGRARGAARAALAESLQVAGHASKTSFSAGRMSVKDSKPRPLSRSLEAAAPGQVGFGSPLQLFVCLSCCLLLGIFLVFAHAVPVFLFHLQDSPIFCFRFSSRHENNLALIIFSLSLSLSCLLNLGISFFWLLHCR